MDGRPDRRRVRSTPRERARANDPRYEAGQRLKRALHVARARAGITSDIQMSRQAGVSYDTLMNWFSGRTAPRGHELRKVAEALDVAYPVLEAAYNGSEPEPLPLQDSVRELVDALRDLVAELRLTRAEQVTTAETMADALDALSRPQRLLKDLSAEGSRRLDAAEERSPRRRPTGK